MVILKANVSEYASGYVKEWMKQNKVDMNTALDQILTSIREEAEGK